MANPWFSAFKPEELTEIADRTGKKLIYFEYDGILFPPFPGIDKRLSALPKLPGRDDDIVIAAFPKSGTHWMWEVLQMILNNSPDYSGREKLEQFLEMVDAEALGKLKSPRVLNTHVRPSLYPEDFVKRKCKIVYLIRNPKDAYVSFFNHTRSIKPYSYDGEWSDYFELAIQGKTETNLWFDYVDAWDKFFKDHPELPVLTLYYEESKQDLLTTVKKLSSFIGVNLTEDVSKEIALACSFSQMKTAKVKAYPKEHLFIWDKGEYTMYRKGVAGDWKNYFTVAQNERFNALYKERMKNSKHYHRYLDQ